MITKEQILEITKGGFLFYKYVIPSLKVQGTKCKSVLNPFYPDSNPSLSIYFVEGHWFFKDHGSPEYAGDAFQFASFFFDLDISEDFPEILRLMYEIDYSKISYKENIVKSKPKANKEFKLFRRSEDAFLPHELEYFGQFGITEEILKSFNVIPIEGYMRKNEDGSWYPKKKSVKDVLVAYLFDGGAKIYSPNPKTFGYVGNKPSDYVFGFENIEGGTVILTGGEKDVLTLSFLGYTAICLNSESDRPSKRLLQELYESKTTLISMYDNDETGKREMQYLFENHGIEPFYLPESITSFGGKDISDYVKNGLTKEVFDEVYNSFLIKNKTVNKQKNSSMKKEKVITEKEKNPLFFPEEIYENLPNFLKKCCEGFKTPREKSMILLSSIVTLGNMFKNIEGFYGNDTVGTNLYLFVSAPASAGKGALKLPKLLGQAVHKFLLSQSFVTTNSQGEEETVTRVFFIPANSTAASIMQQLSNNEGRGMVFETEADSLTFALGREHGDFSEILRCGTHHETISQNRKKGGLIEVERTNFGILISGTPGQLKALISDVENGLFSRFAFFEFPANYEWMDVFEEDKSKQGDYFSQLGQEVLSFYKVLDEMENTIDFSFTDEQRQIFNEVFTDWSKTVVNLSGGLLNASIKRLGLIAFRIAMTLSATRLMDDNSKPTKLICNDEDFLCALEIAECLKYHFQNISIKLGFKREMYGLSSHDMVDYFEALPNECNVKEAKEIAESLNLNERTAEGYRRIFCKKGLMWKPKHSLYAKF